MSLKEGHHFAPGTAQWKKNQGWQPSTHYISESAETISSRDHQQQRPSAETISSSSRDISRDQI